jgi:GTPase SAR1 family protein
MILQRAGKSAGPIAVAICGPDGSGKSTVVEELTENLDLNHVPWRHVHVRPYRLDGAIPRIRTSRPVDALAIRDPHAIRQYTPALAAIKALIMIVDALTLWIDRLIMRRCGGVLIIERSIVDIFIDPTRYGLSRLPSNILRRLSCRTLVADLLVVCHCNANLVFARKGETNIQAIASQYSRWGMFESYSSLSGRIVRIDTSRPLHGMSLGLIVRMWQDLKRASTPNVKGDLDG